MLTPDTLRSRRAFLTSAFQTGILATVSRVSPYLSARGLFSQGEPATERRIARSIRPQDWETPAPLLNSWITPNDLFYIRCHFYTPTVDVATWSLRVEGEVDQPLTLGMADLQRMPRVTLPVTLECAGNGRAFFDPPVAGTQWQRGAVGNARWTGVRLADVLTRAGLKGSGRYLWLRGADRPMGRAPELIRQLPVDKALHPDTLLAYEMNGEPLPVPNGFPLRAIVPGWEGAYSVKWLTRIQVSDREHDGFWVQTAYRYPRLRVAPGAMVDPTDMAPLMGLAVKSIITSPSPGRVPLGQAVDVAGFAWAGLANITSVDVSVDNGSTWVPAVLGTDKAPYAWRQFEYRWTPAERGSFVVISRATDDQGRVQPIVVQWNPSGYLWNVVDQVRVDVGMDAPGRGPAANIAPAASTRRPSADEARGAQILRQKCLGCHRVDMVEQQRLGAAAWAREIDKMSRWGADVGSDDQSVLVDYLAAHFGPR